jgi:hypothetical protein
MTVRESDLLYYVTINTEDTYSVFNRMTDKLILSEVTEVEATNFLINNNPSHSFVVPPMTPDLYPPSVSMSGASFCTPSEWSSYPWDTLPSLAPTHEQLQLNFGEDHEDLSERINDLANELLGNVDDCDSDTD